jgi:hypothetical protein
MNGQASRPAMREPTTWTDFSHLRWTRREPEGRGINKVDFAKLLDEMKLPQPKVLKKFRTPDDFDFSDLPDCFVLKPSNLWSTKGVMILHRICRRNAYFDAFGDRVLDFDQIVTKQKEILRSYGVNGTEFFVEERVFSENNDEEIPFDYKLFSFYGVIRFILQVDRNHNKPKLAFFDGDFKSIGTNKVFIPDADKVQTVGERRKPGCAHEMLDLARQLSLTLKWPFVSIDCYASDKGAMFGELTRTPGGPYYGMMYRFTPEFDVELGAEWRRACDELGMEIPKVEETFVINLKGRKCREVGPTYPR